MNHINLSRKTCQTLRKEALEEYLAGGLKETSIVYQVHHNYKTQTHCDREVTLVGNARRSHFMLIRSADSDDHSSVA